MARGMPGTPYVYPTEEVVMFGRHHAGIEHVSTAEVERPTQTGTVPRQREISEVPDQEELQREKYAGTNWGACFFGWLVAVALTVLLVGITAAVAAAIGAQGDLTKQRLADNAGTTGITAGIAALVILAIAYYYGGYVAGRMSRFEGAKQGVAVWVIGLVATLIAAAVGVAFGTEYDVIDRLDLPTLSVPDSQLGVGGLIAGGAVLIATLLASMAGGKVGRRYHKKVDRVG